jgi:predicted Zn-ribbon and HTH transcriptional regulator
MCVECGKLVNCEKTQNRKTKRCESHCPQCDSERIDWDAWQDEDDMRRQPAKCKNCGTEFVEVSLMKYFTTEY